MSVKAVLASSRAARSVHPRRAKRRHRLASSSYLKLVTAYPIHPLRSPEDLDEAVVVLDKLLSRRKPLDTHEQDYLESLSHEIERYEAVAYPMPRVSGAEMFRHLMEARESTLSEVAEATGIALSTLSAILTGKRQLNRKHIQALARHFGVEPGVFFD
jgi:HTH-type transcriptional regulator / antitoxin HigA